MPPKSTAAPQLARQKKLALLMRQNGQDALLIHFGPNIRYLTGFDGSFGYALALQGEGFVFSDPRYEFAIAEETVGYQPVVSRPQELFGKIAAILKKRKIAVLHCEGEGLAHETWLEIRSALGGLSAKISPALAAELRKVKDEREIELIRKAAACADRTFSHMKGLIRPGVAEKDLLMELKCHLFRQKVDGLAFEPIVAAGPRSAFAHGKASGRKIRPGEFVLLDFGAVIDGYHSDMTRTVVAGRPDAETRRIYMAVKDAQQRALDAAASGVAAKTLDRIARKSLGEAGLGKYFTHGLGHGVGLEIHEAPRVNGLANERLKKGCVITIEPGVYIEGLGGVRIEDTVAIGAEGPKILTRSSKKLLCL